MVRPRHRRKFSTSTATARAHGSASAPPLVLDDDGKVSGGVVTIHDIDKDRREMERLAEMAANLKNKLATHR